MRDAVRTYVNEYRRIVFAGERWNAVLSLLQMVGTASIWLYVASGVLARRLTIGDLALPASENGAPKPNLRGAIIFDNVSFRYPGADKDTLRNVSFTLQPGERLALVGENGAGKTTLIKLLTRLFDPTEGAITCDGVDLRDMTPEEWQR
jgi:ABC-type multidrug transport system fused ATPase/permease subunit